MNRAHTLKIIRIFTQIAFFGLFLWIFFRSLNPFLTTENPFLKYDPLILFTHLNLRWRYILPITGMVILTVVFGRFFCGWVCPLGSVIDTLDLIIKPLRQRNPLARFFQSFELKLIKTPPSWFLLGAVFFTLFFTPPVLQYFHPNVWIIRIFSLSGLGIAFLGLLALLSMHSRRFWCTTVCPLGALYGLLATFPGLRLAITSCSSCGRCNSCPMKAALSPDKAVLHHQCTLCFDFEKRCPVKGFRYGRNGMRKVEVFDASRRRFLHEGGILAGGIAAGALFTTVDTRLSPLLGGYKSKGSLRTRLIRPPGVTAVNTESRFVERCLRCFQCVRSCPNEIIKITGIGFGFDSLFTPKVEFGQYGCDYNCQVCQLVCPNYAIPLQTLEEKQNTKMGIVRIYHSLCVVFAQDTNCLVCEEVCPVPEKAVKYEEKTKMVNGEAMVLRYPYVDSPLCIGCGICQAHCPVFPKAIVVHRA
jgi:polyferredoxin/Pyruvate/2-oxoacid:ferredoxin oxidoreductase delta subunit